ncbi:MAG: valine--tRNA ligase [Bacteroidia bacterium]|jgi:valyl-tRNA synthetase|nr:valine--tRNA ligase [Bacteroidia bacterium]
MSISTKYDPSEIEDKWYSYWMENGFFRSVPDEREPYTVVIPPPNVTGVLHMGHMLNNTIQDVLVRKARMEGKNACWVPGTDHASIATEAKVVNLLKTKGIEKKDLSREDFLSHAWEWKEKYGGIILEQLKKLGASCDWDRTRFTMEEKLSDAVRDVFVDLYNKGLIYRGTRMVNWDPQGKTTLSDEEVIFKEVSDSLYYVKYEGVDFEGYLEVATARPETIAGDVAICVHPEDDRYKHLLGKKVRVPLINREIEILADEYIDREFGTGVLKVTPAHDIHDYEIGLKNKLPVIDTLNDDGTISEDGQLFVGLDRFEARKEWVKSMDEVGLLIKVEDYTHNVGFSERTDVVVEPKISTQWFLNMKDFMKKNPEVLDAVMNDEIQFFPEKLKNTYRHWIENIRDWNISRQLWWGHRIPAFYAPDGTFMVAKDAEDAVLKFKESGIDVGVGELQQDEDVLDTWFSSWLWPISVFDGFESDKETAYYYPTNDLVTAPEIMFFWVARMIMGGYEYRGEKPFKNVYYTGIVRDKQRRKMSKSLGNSPDPLDLIAQYGADSVRLGMLLCAPAGNDILFDESQVEQGRNFANKIWNAYRLVSSWEGEETPIRPYEKETADWFESRVGEVLKQNESHFGQFRLSDALMGMYKLVWDDFCSTYLEGVKPPYGEKISSEGLSIAKEFLSNLMKMIHPIMPFISEEIHQGINPGSDCITASYPKMEQGSSDDLDVPLSVITEVRNLRVQQQLSPKQSLKVEIKNPSKEILHYLFMIGKLANIEIVDGFEDASNLVMLPIQTMELWIELEKEINKEEEISKIDQELKHLTGFLTGVMKKLGNEKFMANAKPDVIEREQKKKEDAETKIKNLEQQKQVLLNK